MPKGRSRSTRNHQPAREAASAKPPAKKGSLEDTCRDIKKSIATERLDKAAAEKRALHKTQEDELIAMTYGPNWRNQMPAWSKEANRAAPAEEFEPAPPTEPEFEDDEEDEDDYGAPIPLSRQSGVRLNKKAS